MEKGKGAYNVVVIGAGTAGLVTAAGTAGLGGRVALIERDRMGGDCLNTGCVPSKALIASTRQIAAIRRAADYGLKPMDPQFDFKEVFERMRSRRAKIEPNDSQERFESLGVDVFRGEATFIDPHTVQVGDVKLRARNFVIATGGRPAVPPIDGIDDVPFHTNETIFDELDEQPRRLAVIGGGPIGCELSQVFQRLGTSVTVFETESCIMSKEDPDVAAFVKQVLTNEGMAVLCGTRVKSARKTDGGAIELKYEHEGGEHDGEQLRTFEADALLIAAGRRPNIESLNLDAIDVETNKRGVVVNDYLQSTQPHIFAAGDVAGSFQFTHWADAQARVVIQNILMPGRLKLIAWKKNDPGIVPWATYVEPEVAHVGLNETQAKAQNVAYDLWRLELDDVDRAIVADETEGFVKVLTKKNSDRIIGVTIVSHHGGELLHEFVLAMKHKIGLGGLAGAIHAYPTLAEVARKLGDQYNKTRLSPTVSKVFAWLYKRARKKVNV